MSFFNHFQELNKFAFYAQSEISPGDIETFASKFIQFGRGDKSFPRNPKFVLLSYDIDVSLESMAGWTHGSWIKNDYGYHIYLNNHDASTKQNFTAFHEVFEILMNNPKLSRWIRSFHDIERSANRFSAECLMPKKHVLRAIKYIEHYPPYLIIDNLCEYYGVSRQVATIRLKELGILNSGHNSTQELAMA